MTAVQGQAGLGWYTTRVVGTASLAWTLPLLGRAIDRWGPRLLMAAVGAVFGAVLIALSAVTGLVGLTAGWRIGRCGPGCSGW